MKIAGLVKTSLIDYPGNIAAVVFTQGCNIRCGFCHNPDLLEISSPGVIDEKTFFDYLESRKNILDGVVITGGEPTLQADLETFIKKIKELGFLVKLDTNGTNFTVLENLVKKDLIDYVAMDIKGPLEKYETICGPVNKQNIKKSIEFLINGQVEYEFRTTVLPHYHSEEDFNEIGILLRGAKKYVLQGFRPEITFDRTLAKTKPFTREELEQIKGIFSHYIKNVIILDNLK